MSDCGDFLTKQFDGRDGDYDGVFTPLAHLVSHCQQIPATTLLDDLKALHDEGVCPDELLDGVGLTELKDSVCQYVWGPKVLRSMSHMSVGHS